MNECPAPDEELVRRSARGDAQAFAELYARRRVSVHRFALQMTGSRTLADDITQEAFLTVINKLSDYDTSRGSFTGYLLGIARKHILRHFEDWAQDSVFEDTAEETGAVSESLIERRDPLGNLTQDESIKAVRRAVLALPSRYREAIVLCEFQEMTYEEAADAIGCAVGTVRSRLHRARALLLRRLSAPEIEHAVRVRKPKGCLA